MNTTDPYKTIIMNIQIAEPSDDLCRRIEGKICHARIVRARLHAAAHGALVLGALVVLIPVISGGLDQAAQSGLYDYLSLITSDSSYLLTNWRQTILSVAESVPVVSVALSLGIFLVFAHSLRRGSLHIRSAHVFKLS